MIALDPIEFQTPTIIRAKKVGGKLALRSSVSSNFLDLSLSLEVALSLYLDLTSERMRAQTSHRFKFL